MDDEILEELKKIYKNLYIEVEFVDFRKYKIICKLPIIEETIDFTYTYNVNFTKDYNIDIIKYNIDKQIIKCYKREVINE